MTDIRINKKTQIEELLVADIQGLPAALDSCEKTANKVTSISEGETNTDKYPTVSAVSTYVTNVITTVNTDLDDHKDDKNNPHEVTKSQVGLGNCNNTSDIDKPVSTAQEQAISAAITQEVTNRNTAISNAINTEVGNRNTAINTAINTEITNRNAAIATEAQLREAADSELSTTITSTDTRLTNQINEIDELIPTAATTDNKLVDRALMNSTINNLAAFYITYDANGKSFPTRAALLNATKFYSNGKERTPTRNDYAIVAKDDEHDNATTRFIYDGSQWAFQWVINNAPFTQEQQDAIDSTITKTIVDGIIAHTESKSNPHLVTKAQVGLGNCDNTSDMSKPISTATQTALDNKADKVDTYTKSDVDNLLDTKQDNLTVQGPLSLSAGGETNATLTIASYVGATATTAGTKGIVPGSTAGSLTRFLNVDGTWKEVAQPVRHEIDLSSSLNGTKKSFTLTENVGTDFDVYYNGMRLKNGKNYTISGTTLTLSLSVAPEAGEDLDVIYRK